MRIGMLTGGGDCPGLNAVMRAVVRKADHSWGDEIIGFRDGWRGVIEGGTMRVDVELMRGTLPRGGTILGSSRTNPFNVEGGVDRCLESLDRLGIDALIAIGGEDTLGVAAKLSRPRGQGRRRPQDHRQRPVGHRADLRLRHRGPDLRRRHRPAPHHRRVPRPGDGRRGHGPPRRAHRHLGRHRRGSDHDPGPRGALRHRGGVSRPSPHVTPRAGSPPSWWWPRVPPPRRGP